MHRNMLFNIHVIDEIAKAAMGKDSYNLAYHLWEGNAPQWDFTAESDLHHNKDAGNNNHYHVTNMCIYMAIHTQVPVMQKHKK